MGGSSGLVKGVLTPVIQLWTFLVSVKLGFLPVQFKVRFRKKIIDSVSNSITASQKLWETHVNAFSVPVSAHVGPLLSLSSSW